MNVFVIARANDVKSLGVSKVYVSTNAPATVISSIAAGCNAGDLKQTVLQLRIILRARHYVFDITAEPESDKMQFIWV